MSNEIFEDLSLSLMTNERWKKDGQDRQLHIVDLGTIVAISDGKATVRGYERQDGKVVVYEDVEVLYIGSIGGGFDIVPAGTLCLLIRTAIPVLDTKTDLVVSLDRPYAGSGMKAIPLSNLAGADVHAGFNEAGDFQFFTDNGLAFTIGNDQASISVKGDVLTIIDSNGTIQHMSPSQKFYQRIDDSGIETIFYDGQNNPLRRTVQASDSISYYIYKNNDWALTFQITNSQGVVKFGDKTQVSVQNEQISMTTSADVSATLTKSAITLQTSDSMKIEMKSDSVTINGHLKVT